MEKRAGLPETGSRKRKDQDLTLAAVMRSAKPLLLVSTYSNRPDPGAVSARIKASVRILRKFNLPLRPRHGQWARSPKLNPSGTHRGRKKAGCIRTKGNATGRI